MLITILLLNAPPASWFMLVVRQWNGCAFPSATGSEVTLSSDILAPTQGFMVSGSELCSVRQWPQEGAQTPKMAHLDVLGYHHIAE